MTYERQRPPFTISTDPTRLDVAAVHAYLTRSYWSAGIPRDTVARALSSSLCFGLYHFPGASPGVQFPTAAGTAGAVPSAPAQGSAGAAGAPPAPRSAADQIGIARVISDLTTFAYLCDVYVLEAWRGRGLGRWLMECVMEHPGLSGLRRFSLVTRDAHELYRPFGFTEVRHPERHMELLRPDVYTATVATTAADEPTRP